MERPLNSIHPKSSVLFWSLGWIVLSLICSTAKAQGDMVVGTSVIAIGAKDGILVAADSRTEDPFSPYTYNNPSCKISRIGRSQFFVYAGWTKDKRSSYYLDSIAIQAARTEVGLENVVSRFQANAIQQITISCAGIRKRDRKGYDFICTRPIQSFIWGVENDSIRAFKRTFIIKDSLSRPFVDVIRDDPKNVANFVTTLGYADSITVLDSTSRWWDYKFEIVARMWIDLQISKHSDAIGRPIDLLVLGKNGAAEWYDKNCHCPDMPK
jgi:hypothetical protein